MDDLAPGKPRETLESGFALIREAREWLRLGRELGFGALADPQGWLERIEGVGAVLEPAEFLDAGSLLETAGWLRQQFREEATKFPLQDSREYRADTRLDPENVAANFAFAQCGRWGRLRNPAK